MLYKLQTYVLMHNLLTNSEAQLEDECIFLIIDTRYVEHGRYIQMILTDKGTFIQSRRKEPIEQSLEFYLERL